MGKRSSEFRDEPKGGIGGDNHGAIVKTFRVLASIGRWLMLFAIIIIVVGALSYIFKFDLPQLAVDILAAVLVIGLIITSIMLMRALWWSPGKDVRMDFHEAWKLFAMKVMIFLSMIVALLALPTFITLVKVSPDATAAHLEAIRLIKKAKKLKGDNNH